MKSESQNNLSNRKTNLLLLIVFVSLISILLIFKNTFFESNFAIKSFGEISMDPEVAFQNNKPTFLEFYAEWCEICKEMAPGIIDSQKNYHNDINFVFLNVDNPKWEKYIKDFNVNGIPQMVFLDNNSEIKFSLVGLNEEEMINDYLNKTLNNYKSVENVSGTQFSSIDNKRKMTVNPRSHS